jgi:antitoxin component of MazEF toxin-antitoxin module
MDDASILVRARQVGNSIALFVPADVCSVLGIVPNSEVVAHLHPKKQRTAIRGMLKGKKIDFSEEDRLDARY